MHPKRLIRVHFGKLWLAYRGVYSGVLSYADDITRICPSIGGLNHVMLNICIKFALENQIILNQEKKQCIKF